MYSSEPKERLILWNTEPTSNPPADHYFVWIKDGKFYTLDSQGVQKEYATIEELSAKVNTSDIVDDLNSTDVDKPLSANQGKVLQDGKEDADSTILKEGDVEDGLNSTSVTKPLSANQGKVLQDGKEDADSTILKEGDVENSLNSTSTNKPLSANQGKQLNDDKASLSTINNQPDFYEEGTWNPIYNARDSNFTTIVMDVAFAKYIKIGQLVYVTARIRTDELSGGSGTVEVINFPFLAAGDIHNSSAYSMFIAQSSGWEVNPIGLTPAQNGNKAFIQKRLSITGSNSSINVSDMTSGVNTGANQIIFSGSYIAK